MKTPRRDKLTAEKLMKMAQVEFAILRREAERRPLTPDESARLADLAIEVGELAFGVAEPCPNRPPVVQPVVHTSPTTGISGENSMIPRSPTRYTPAADGAPMIPHGCDSGEREARRTTSEPYPRAGHASIVVVAASGTKNSTRDEAGQGVSLSRNRVSAPKTPTLEKQP